MGALTRCWTAGGPLPWLFLGLFSSSRWASLARRIIVGTRATPAGHAEVESEWSLSCSLSWVQKEGRAK